MARICFLLAGLLTFLQTAKAEDFRILDCRPKAFIRQVQERIASALRRTDYQTPAAPTLTRSELSYIKDRIPECDKTYFGPWRDKFNGRLNDLRTELTEKKTDLATVADKKAQICSAFESEKCKADIRSKTETALTSLKRKVDRDVGFYSDLLYQTEEHKYDAVLPVYEAALFAEMIAEQFRDRLLNTRNVRIDSIQIGLKNHDEKIIKSMGSIDRMVAFRGDEEQRALTLKYGLPLPAKLAEMCDNEICFDPELIYAQFNRSTTHSGQITADFETADYSYHTTAAFELTDRWTEETLQEVEEILREPTTEAPLYDSPTRKPDHQIGKMSLTTTAALKPALHP